MLTNHAQKILVIYFYFINPGNYEKEVQYYYGVIHIVAYRAYYVAGLLGHKRL